MALTDIAIRKAQYTGTPAYGQKLSDGGGLFIWISKHGKYWQALVIQKLQWVVK